MALLYFSVAAPVMDSIDKAGLRALFERRPTSPSGQLPKHPDELPVIAEGMTACFTNAEHLLLESRLLLGGGHVARAVALAVIGIEELGKIPDLHDTYAGIVLGDDPASSWKSFWRRFRHHKAKQRTMGQYGSKLENEHGISREVYSHLVNWWGEDDYAKLDELKQSCLYVDFVQSRFLLPDRYEEDLTIGMDELLTFGEERLDLFAARHRTHLGSIESLMRQHMHLAELIKIDRDLSTEEHFELRQRVLHQEIQGIRESETERDYMGQMQTAFHKASISDPPNYTMTAETPPRVLSTNREDIKQALGDLCALLRHRTLLPEQLPRATMRSMEMIKVAYWWAKFVLKANDHDAGSLVFGSHAHMSKFADSP